MAIVMIGVLGSAGASGQDLGDLNVEAIYEQLCAQCHGAEFQGGMGGVLVDGVWKHGETDADIFRSIQKGNLDLGMAPWEGVLTDDQIRSMIIFLREQEYRVAQEGAKPPVPLPDTVSRTRHHAYRVESVAEGLDIPWAIAFLPSGGMLVTERPGGLRIIEPDGRLHPDPVQETPPVIHHGQGGLMEVALHPEYERNGWIYLGFSDGWYEDPDERKEPRCLTAVARGRLEGHRWVDQEWIFRADRRFYSKAGVHFGTRFVFRDGYIFFVIGERGGWHEAQDLSRPNGKIFRLHDDGRVPDDNPFVGRADAIPGIWSYGHRNPQGLDLDPRGGGLYSTEHGPRGGDELNRIERGANYGWPVITYGMHYSGKPITSLTHQDGMEQPVIHWTPSIAVCGLDFYEGDRFPAWRHDLFTGALRKEEIQRLRIRDGRVVERETVLKNIGRVRDVADGPDGAIYVLLNEPHRLIRMVPADS